MTSAERTAAIPHVADHTPHTTRHPAVRAQRRVWLGLCPPLGAAVGLRAAVGSSGQCRGAEFDPLDGGIEVRALFLSEMPGPMTAGPGFISRNNDDLTAEATFRFMQMAGIPLKLTVTWNVVP